MDKNEENQKMEVKFGFSPIKNSKYISMVQKNFMSFSFSYHIEIQHTFEIFP